MVPVFVRLIRIQMRLLDTKSSVWIFAGPLLIVGRGMLAIFPAGPSMFTIVPRLWARHSCKLDKGVPPMTSVRRLRVLRELAGKFVCEMRIVSGTRSVARLF